MTAPLLMLSCDNASSGKKTDLKPATEAAADGFATGKGVYYCEGNVAADGLGCMIKIDGIAYKMQRENGELYEDNAGVDQSGQTMQVEVTYKKTGTKHKLMDGSDGPEIIAIRSVRKL